MSNFKQKLTAMFESVQPQFRAATIERYRANAETSFNAWLERMKGPKPTEITNRIYREVMMPPTYAKCSSGSYAPRWDSLAKDIAEGRFSIDFARAEKDANAEVDSAKLHFVTKQTKKLETATKLRKDKPTKLDGLLRCDGGVVTGHLNVTYKGGDRFSISMNWIVNYRYNGRGGCTSFYQFPTRFTTVYIEGKPITGAKFSEKWMSVNFGSPT